MSKSFTWKNKVYFGDTDAAGIVYHGRYVYWMEAARIDFLDYLGCSYTEFQKMGVGFIPKSVQLDFNSPMVFSDEFIINVSFKSVSKASFEILSVFKLNDKTVATGIVKLACVDEKKWKPIALPERFLECLKS
jgi:acyl-CoA thioester hydrolase